MATQQARTPEIAEREVVLSRLFDASRDVVFEAWTNPKHVAQWWGPDGFTLTIHEMDVRPGGVWRFIMHGPDGVDYPNKIVYTSVDKPELLAYIHSDDGGELSFEGTITFEARGGQTEVTMRSLFPTPAARQLVVEKHGAIEGGKQHLARLAEHLAKT